MSDLTAFRTHCQRMVTAKHRPDCTGFAQGPEERDGGPRPTCPGCVTEPHRLLWRQLANETDAWLRRAVAGAGS